MGPPSLPPEMIQAVLDAYKSPARGAAAEFYAAGQQYAIDPAYGLAWFVHESRAGTRGIAPVLKSPGNLRAPAGAPAYQGYLTYPTWEAGIDDWFRRISLEYIRGRGLLT